jgi:Flp pilus assembly protein TadG
MTEAHRSNLQRLRGRGDGGWAVAEAVIFAPFAILALGVVLLAALRGGVQSQVTTAARDAARAASLQSSFPQAQSEAQRIVAAKFAGTRPCARVRVTVAQPSTFRAGGQVTVTVVCQVDLSGVAVPGLPGSMDVIAESTEILDRHRGGL